MTPSLLRLICLCLVVGAAGTHAFSTAVPWGSLRRVSARSSRASACCGLRMAEEPPLAPAAASKTAQRRSEWSQRRQVLGEAMRLGACGCVACFTGVGSPRSALALAQLVEPSASALQQFDLPRDGYLDAAFACGMATGMSDYEEAASVRKAKLFRALLESLPSSDAVVAEVGMGSFPNAPYFAQQGAPGGMDIIGIDPNDKMASYAQDNARRARLTGKRPVMTRTGPRTPSTVRIVHGVSEALPLEDDSCDAVVCTLTLCSVVDPAQSLAEIKRVLKPGGKFLFWEHVLSETDADMARKQVALTPSQVKRADGCHLNRRTGTTIKEAGFSEVASDYFELQDFGFLNPTAAGIATV